MTGKEQDVVVEWLTRFLADQGGSADESRAIGAAAEAGIPEAELVNAKKGARVATRKDPTGTTIWENPWEQSRRGWQEHLRRLEQSSRRKQERLDQARHSGEHLVVFLPATPASGRLAWSVENGDQVTFRHGTAEVVNDPARSYDYRVTLGADQNRHRPVVQQVTVTQRVNGPAVTIRGLSKDRVGELTERVAALMWRLDDGVGRRPVKLHAKEVRRLLSDTPRRPLSESKGARREDAIQVLKAEVERVRRTGGKETESIRQALKARGLPHSESYVAKLKREAGLQRQPGRPRHR